MPVKYNEQFKEQAVQKAIANEGNITPEELAKQLNMGYSTLQRWVRNYKQPGGNSMPTSIKRRPKDWSASERLGALIVTGNMDEQARNAYCREQGLYTKHLEQWQRNFSDMPTGKRTLQSQESKLLKKENKALQKELRRKDQALAETTAILVLKKKLAALYGEDEG